MDAITITHLQKAYGKINAVDIPVLNIRQGEIDHFGFRIVFLER